MPMIPALAHCGCCDQKGMHKWTHVSWRGPNTLISRIFTAFAEMQGKLSESFHARKNIELEVKHERGSKVNKRDLCKLAESLCCFYTKEMNRQGVDN